MTNLTAVILSKAKNPVSRYARLFYIGWILRYAQDDKSPVSSFRRKTESSGFRLFKFKMDSRFRGNDGVGRLHFVSLTAPREAIYQVKSVF